MTTKTNKFVTIVATIFLIGFLFYMLRELQSILVPFFLAIILSFVFEPLLVFLKSKRIPSSVAIAIVLLIIIVIANIASVFIVTSINTFSNEFPRYEAKFRDMSVSMISNLNIPKEDVDKFNESIKITNLLQQGSITAALTSLFTGFIGIFGDFILILIYIVFILTEITSIKQRISKAFSTERAKEISGIITEIFTDVRKYISRKTLINLVQGVVFAFILWLFDVDFYIIWGFLCFLSHYIPNIGSLISTILPAITALLQYDSIITPIIIVILLIIVQNIIGNVIEPKFLGDQLDLSPLLLLVSLIFWGYVWGIVGMILSVPIMSMIKIILSKFPTTKPISIMMSYGHKSVLVKEESRLTSRIKTSIKKTLK
ncbi:MAG: AI-2E family transporter [Ignavibacteriae bacterium]|nr:MAG: AI-2E family transporter [Ignavibacteriota bacterium]